MSLADLKLIRQQYLRSFSQGDSRLVPASGATVTVYRQGATLAGGGQMFPETERDLTVRNTGVIQPGDLVQVGLDSSRVLRVVELKAGPKIRCVNDGPATFSVSAGERLVAYQQLAPTYSDSRATAPTSPNGVFTVGSSGIIEFYTSEDRVDLYVSGGGTTAGWRFEVEGGWRQPALPWLDARDYWTIQDAIDALPPNVGGTVVIPEGTYELTTGLVLPADKRVRLIGAGRDRTILHCADATIDIVTVKGQDCTLEGLTIQGPGSGPSNQSETAGRGVVVGRLGTGAAVVSGFTMLACRVTATASWGLWLIGWEDVGGVPAASLSILGSYARCQFDSNGSFGLVRARTGCTTQVFESCSFLRAVGWSLLAESVEGLSILDCVLEDSDDSKPYVDLSVATNVRIVRSWFEHHGGHGSVLDSNEQFFVQIRRLCRTVVFDACHFVRQGYSIGGVAVFPTITTHDIHLGDDSFIDGGPLNVSVRNCDFNLPGPLTTDREIRSASDAELFMHGGLVLGRASDPPNLPVFGTPGLSQMTVTGGGQGTAYGSTRSSLLPVAGRIRLPRSSAAGRAAASSENNSWQVGDITLDTGGDDLWLFTASGWRRVELTT